MTRKTKVALYIRVSTQEQAKEGYSIGEQTDRLQKYAEAHGWIVANVYVDAGHSGANQNRPALQEMIFDVKAGKIDKVVVYKLDRLSRSQKDTLEIIEDVLLKNNCDFESMTEKFDTSTSFGKAMVGILAVFAQLEREQIKERMSMGLEARIKEGKWRGGSTVPFGYDYDQALGYLVVNEYEAMIVKEIFNRYVSGVKLRTIQRQFQEEGYALRSGRTDTRNFRYIMSNKTYLGYLRFKDKWIKGNHDPIIDEETFNRANELLMIGKEIDMKLNPSGVREHVTVLGGLLWCKHCGGRYSKCLTGNKQYGYNQKYGCYSRHKKVKEMIVNPNCKNKYYKIDELDEIIFNEIRKLVIDPEYIHHIINQNKEPDSANNIASIRKRIKDIGNQMSRLMDLYGTGIYTIHEIEEKVTPLKEEREKLQKQLEVLQLDNSKLSARKAIEVASTFESVLEKGDLQDIRNILEILIEKIEIDNEDITIHWNFQ